MGIMVVTKGALGIGKGVTAKLGIVAALGSRRRTGPAKEREKEVEITIVKGVVEGFEMTGIETMIEIIPDTGTWTEIETVNATEQGLEIEDGRGMMTGPGTGGETEALIGVGQENEGMTVIGDEVVVAALLITTEGQIATDQEVLEELLQRLITSRSCWMSMEMPATQRVRTLPTVVSIQKRQLMMM